MKESSPPAAPTSYDPWPDRRGPRPYLTLGMPVYNCAEYLSRTLESLLAQSFSDFEILISDDRSTDETAEIASEYAKKDRRIHFHQNPRNLGIYLNFNLPLIFARGRYFMWAGQDDLWEPDYVGSMIQLLEDEPHAVMALPALDHIDGEDHVFHSYPHLTDLEARDRLDTMRRFISQDDVLGKTNAFHAIVRTAPLRQIGGYTRWCRFMFGEDTLLAFRLLEYGTIRIHPDPLWHKRWLSTSLGATVYPPRGTSLPARLRGIARDFAELSSYMEGYQRAIEDMHSLSPDEKRELLHLVDKRKNEMITSKWKTTVSAGARRLMGQKSRSHANARTSEHP